MRYQFIRAEKANYPVTILCEVMQVARSGYYAWHKRPKCLRKKENVRVKKRRPFKVTTDSRHNLPVSENLIRRNFEAQEPNRVWASDITYVWTKEGWLYLAIILDLFSRRVVGWAISKRLDKKLVMDAFNMALWRRRPNKGLILPFRSRQPILE